MFHLWNVSRIKVNPVDRSHLDDARLSSQAPICHTGVGNYFSSASLPSPSYVSQEYRANQSQSGSFPHHYNSCTTQPTLPGSYFNASHVPSSQQFQSGYNTCPSISRRPLPEPHQFQSGYKTCPSFSRRPLPELCQFSGEDLSDFLDYPSWRYSFQTLIQNSGISNSGRIYYLGCYVMGTSLETIKGYLVIGAHRTSLLRNVRNLFKKVRQFLRNSLTNFFDEFSYNANGLF